MRLAEYSVRKKNPSEGDGAHGDSAGPLFCSLAEGTERTARDFPLGKILLYTDEKSFARLGGFVRSPRAVSVVQDKADALPLFSMPDGIVCVVAAGKADIMRCARYFSEIRAVPCRLFPSEASLCGTEEGKAYLPLGGKQTQYPLGGGEVYADLGLMERSFASAYAEILLFRLALFEEEAGRKLRGDKSDRAPAADEAFRLCGYVSGKEELSKETLVRVCAKLRRLRAEGAPQGEGTILAQTLAKDGDKDAAWRAYVLLSSLYAAFFRAGKPRRYVVPDYSARRAACGEGAKPPIVPTAEEYARRAVALERVRGALTAEIDSLVALRKRFARIYRAFGGDDSPYSAAPLRYLPERCPDGLSAIIRDFGLMEQDLP